MKYSMIQILCQESIKMVLIQQIITFSLENIQNKAKKKNLIAEVLVSMHTTYYCVQLLNYRKVGGKLPPSPGKSPPSLGLSGSDGKSPPSPGLSELPGIKLLMLLTILVPSLP